MPITRIFWGGASNQDIHVLRDKTSRDLTVTGLRFFDDTTPDVDSVPARDYLDDNDDITLTFQPLFKGAAGAGGVFSGLDIDVDMDTGEVTPKLTAARNNLIIEATAKDTANNVISTVSIRVHIHKSVTTFRLTPKQLTVRPAASTRTEPEETNYMFTVRALFDDGTMGDLTEDHGVTWSSNPPGRVGSKTGKLVVGTTDKFNNTITITATLPADLGGGSQTATLRIGRAWRDNPSMPKTTIIPGGGWPGTTLPDKAPNVLFLSDGFTAADVGSFEQAVTTMVNHLKTDPLLQPFKLLSTSMNFWRTFVPADSGARGISFRCEIYPVDDPNGTKVGKVVPPPEAPPAHGDWEIGHLIHRVGLPVPADLGIADLPTHWAGLVDKPIPAGVIDQDVIDEWKLIAKRTFIEELDNFPGMAFGEPPAADTVPGTPYLFLHRHRCRRNGLNDFLALLQSDNNVTFGPNLNIGTVWAIPGRVNNADYAVGDFMMVTDNPGRVFTCTGAGTSAKKKPAAQYAAAADGTTVADGTATFRAVPLWFDDAAFVIVVSSFPAGRFQNVTRTQSRTPYIAAGMNSGMTIDIPIAPPSSGGLGFSLDFKIVPPDVSVDTSRVVAHELAHSFGLGDEYVNIRTEAPLSEGELDDSVNLQTEVDTQIDGKINGDQIRWNWHRIRKAAVIAGAPTNVDATTFRIPVILGHGLQFAAGDTVLLRLRRPGELLAKAITVKRAGPLHVVAPKAADAVNVQAAPGVNVTLADLKTFTPGSILFLPVPAPASVRSPMYPFAEMVAKNVKDLITKNHDVLYHQPAPAAVTEAVRRNREIQHPDLDDLAPPLPAQFSAKDKTRIVGLYEGGALYANGIFHPTGTCVMRSAHVETNEFCAVCRYIMVDFVNPFRHFEIDLEYDGKYPLK